MRWVKWRASLTCAARTIRAYQTSLFAWLNWLVRMEQLAANPLAKVGAVKVRGKSVRPSRAFTSVEFAALLRVAPWHRRIAYQFLAYTGARKGEARSLQWADLELSERPCVRFREERTKSARKRVVPLKAELAQALRDHQTTLRESGALGAEVFPLFPSDDAFHADLRRADIEKRDAGGRVVHFHAIRKTFQTWGAVAGVGQRSAQEMLGHSDPALTAGVYTDVAALALHDEVAKLPGLAPEMVQRKTHKMG